MPGITFLTEYSTDPHPSEAVPVAYFGLYEPPDFVNKSLLYSLTPAEPPVAAEELSLPGVPAEALEYPPAPPPPAPPPSRPVVVPGVAGVPGITVVVVTCSSTLIP